MRNEPLIGYLLHQRPYRENRALYVLFSKQHGVVHGVGKKGIPLFAGVQLFATGKQSLKTFSQLQLVGFKPPLVGKNQYAGFYINEILYKLLPIEDATPELWQSYEHCIDSLRQDLTDVQLRLCLRQFEWQLFIALGVVVSFATDGYQQPILADKFYQFILEVGFVPIDTMFKDSVFRNTVPNDTVQKNTIQSTQKDTIDNQQKNLLLSGQQILAMQQGIQENELPSWSIINRLMINHLLGYRPLQSRLLWQQQKKY